MTVAGHIDGSTSDLPRGKSRSCPSDLQFAENVWDPEKKRSQARIVYNCGRADDPAVTERLKRLAHSKRVCELRTSARYGRYVRLTRTGQPKIDRARIKAAERLHGKFVAHGNEDSLSAEDLALGYKQLQRVEEAWRRLKSGLRLRPVYHFASQRIRAHVALSVLALLLERVAERACGDTWRNIRDNVTRIKLAHLSGPDGEVWQVADPGADALKRLKS